MTSTRRAKPKDQKTPRTATNRNDLEHAEPVLELHGAPQWQAWLRANHAQSPAVFLRIAKQKAGGSLTYPAALEVALAWGWVDSQKQALDDA